jgi:hypothetical protein
MGAATILFLNIPACSVPVGEELVEDCDKREYAPFFHFGLIKKIHIAID